MNSKCIRVIALVLVVPLTFGCGPIQLEKTYVISVTPATLGELIAASGVNFPQNTQVLFHIYDPVEKYEEWTILCPAGSYVLTGKKSSWDSGASGLFAVLANQPGVVLHGKLTAPQAEFCVWTGNGVWDVEVCHSDIGDYLWIKRELP
jgi:hypothetical protein